MNNGFVKLWRKSIDSRTFQNEGLWKVWTWCLMRANHKKCWVSVSTGKGETEVELKPGQFIYGRKTAAKELKMKESTIRNRMEKLKSLLNLDMQPDTHYSIVSIINWTDYQINNKKKDRQQDSERTTKGQPEDTDKNGKNDKNNNIPFKEIVSDLNFVLGKNYKHASVKTRDLIKARYNEGFEFDDFKYVHRVKKEEWENDLKQKIYLRPITLYGNRFESYRNQDMKNMIVKAPEEYQLPD